MTKYYNIWYIHGKRWTNATYYGSRKEFHGLSQDPDEPLPLSKQEAEEWLQSAFSINTQREFEILPINNTNEDLPLVKKIHSCVRCGHFNEYAEPNMPDGSFKCKSCRDNPWR